MYIDICIDIYTQQSQTLMKISASNFLTKYLPRAHSQLNIRQIQVEYDLFILCFILCYSLLLFLYFHYYCYCIK